MALVRADPAETGVGFRIININKYIYIYILKKGSRNEFGIKTKNFFKNRSLLERMDKSILKRFVHVKIMYRKHQEIFAAEVDGARSRGRPKRKGIKAQRADPPNPSRTLMCT